MTSSGDTPNRDGSEAPAACDSPRSAATESPASDRRVPWWLPLVFLTLGAAALAIDMPLSDQCVNGHCPSIVQKILLMAELFGHGIGVMLIGVLIWQLDPSRRWALPRLMTMSLGAGLLANIVKLCIQRSRPYYFDFQGNVWATFGKWFPLTDTSSPVQSFPSGHTATAVGLAIGMAWLYPRGRWLFAAFALLVACNRLEEKAHFASDVLVGAAIGSFTGLLCLNIGKVARHFDFWESYWRSRAQSPQDS